MKAQTHPSTHRHRRLQLRQHVPDGSTLDTICSSTYAPLATVYTGKQKMVDTAGRVDKFRKKYAAKAPAAAAS